MRQGINPEKTLKSRLRHKPHRVIIPVYIPSLEGYYQNALKVLKLMLESLLATTYESQTNITVIDNNSCDQVEKFLRFYIDSGKIDKYVKLNENRGKVETVLSEAMASYEDYITISDADVFFRKGWLEESMKIFEVFAPGAVMPLPVPNLYDYQNRACINKLFLSGKLKKDNCVEKRDLIEFELSVGSDGLMRKFYQQQYCIERKGVKACLGAGHFVATYNRNLFDFVNKDKKIAYKFYSGLERDFLDILTVFTGSCRLSTVKPYVYHMGNTPISEKIVFEQKEIDFPELKSLRSTSRLTSFFHNTLFSFLKKGGVIHI